ncbi:helix-turn-helix domain-containing protein, partial [Chryseobacterium contaminans]
HTKTLLKSTHLSIKQVSHELHFENSSVFCRFFKKITGISPRTFRNS